jgi:diguanylate cyclase (GGDEF)-like protein
MAVAYTAPDKGSQHGSAVRRLAEARKELARLDAVDAADGRIAAARADVASREEWLHWLDAGESLAPWADGEWGPAPHAEPSSPRRFGRTVVPESPGRVPDERDTAARARDDSAAKRDRAAAIRDRLAQALDRDERGAASSGRVAAARDRNQAASDRRLAAADREHAAAGRVAAGGDDLTVALRRGAGLAAVQRDLARAHRTGGRLVLAFVDVDGLKAVNDAHGHAAGDRLLKRTADLITTHLRPYDVLVRVGGDEFVCSLGDIEADRAADRFALVSADLATGADPGSISVGLAELQPGDSLDELIERADTALLAVRGDRRTGVARRTKRSSVPHR